MNGADAVLALHSIVAGYGARTVLHGVSLDVPPRAILALCGHNGAGKSTLLKAAFGLLRVRSGDVLYRGHRITNRPVSENVQDGMVFVPQGGGLFPDLSVTENFGIAYQLAKRTQRGFNRALARLDGVFPRLREVHGRKAGVLSGGEQRMVAIGMALIRTPSLVLLDEPSIGLSPLAARGLFQVLGQINRDFGVTLVIAEQNIRLATEICTAVCILRLGQVAWSGTPSELGPNPALDVVRML
jgi:branched-chain amino acid transport system ATP-binding protein